MNTMKYIFLSIFTLLSLKFCLSSAALPEFRQSPGSPDTNGLQTPDANLGSNAAYTGALNSGRCEPLSLVMCSNIGLYNRTRLPNFFGQTSQDEAGLEVNQFWPLVKIACSPMLGFFLCSLYVPVCLDGFEQVLPPCRSVCEAARDGCEPVMGTYGFSWPDKLSCSNFPVNNADSGGDILCMEPPSGHSGAQPGAKINHPVATATHGVDDVIGVAKPVEPVVRPMIPAGPPAAVLGTKGSCSTCQCNEPFKPVDPNYHSYRQLTIGGGAVTNCAQPCHAPYFSTHQQEFASYWIGIWAGLCAAATILTIATALLNPSRFRYPERAIVFMSLCYLLVSLGYIIRLILGHSYVACAIPRSNDVDAPSPPADGTAKMLHSGPAQGATCTIVFLLTYVFGMAAGVWWVILSFTWFLSAGLKWSAEAISNYATAFHVAGWALPCVQAIAVLASTSVDGDPVAGICYTGATHLLSLRVFVIGPLFAHLALGSIFLLAGFVSLIRIRRILGKAAALEGPAACAVPLPAKAPLSTDKLERLMVRIGIFSGLYVLPATVVLGCYFYEERHRPTWELSALRCATGVCIERPEKPEFAVFMLKYCALLGAGVAPVLWIWSRKTLVAWADFILCRRCRKTPAPKQQGDYKESFLRSDCQQTGQHFNGKRGTGALLAPPGQNSSHMTNTSGYLSGYPGGYQATEAMMAVRSHTDVSGTTYQKYNNV